MQLKRLGALVVVVGLSLAQAQADTSESYEMMNHKHYGTCRTWTQMDMLTDQESHHFECKEETFTDVTEIGLSSWSQGRLEVRVGKGVMFHLDADIPVAIRIDKGEVIRRAGGWFPENSIALISDYTLALSLLNDLAKGQRVVIQVGTERGNITLRGSAAAIKDFRRRAGLQPQQTLEIPAH